VLHEIRFCELDLEARAFWVDTLAQPPLLEDRASTVDPPWCGVGALATTILGPLIHTVQFVLDPSLDLALHSAWAGVCVAIVAAFLRLAWRARLVARAPCPVGRHLYPWGYAEVMLDRVRFVPGGALRVDVTVGPARVSGASRIVVRLSTDSWSTVFRLVGTEYDVPHEGLAALATLRFDAAGGYRDAARRTPHGRRPRWTLSPGLATVAVSGFVGLIGGAVPVCAAWRSANAAIASLRGPVRVASLDYHDANEVARAYPYFDWVKEATELVQRDIREDVRSRMESDLRSPYREAMEHVIDDVHPTVDDLDDCYLGPAEIAALNEFAGKHTDGRPVAAYTSVSVGATPSLHPYFDFARPWEHWREARLRMTSACALEPLTMRDTWPARVAFRVQVSWDLVLNGRVVAHRTLTIEPDVIDEVAACARPDRDPAAAEMRAVAGLVTLAIHQDVYEPGRGYWVASVILEGYGELVPCVRRAVATLHVVRENR